MGFPRKPRVYTDCSFAPDDDLAQLTFIFHFRSPSSNDWGRNHWRRTHWKSTFIRRLRYLRGGIEFLHQGRPCHIAITSLRRRLLDRDNLVGGFKPFVDALQLTGIIKNDNPKWLPNGIDYDQLIVKRNADEMFIVIVTYLS